VVVRRTLTLDIELDSAELPQFHVEGDALGGGDSQSMVGHDHATVDAIDQRVDGLASGHLRDDRVVG
jgi:hypothetical protein